MKSVLKIEAIADNVDQELRSWSMFTNMLIPGLGDKTFGTTNSKPKPSYWVAKISGHHNVFIYKREFLRGKKDYRRANSKGSRGVFIWYTLESGFVYEVKAPVSWKKTERYYCIVTEEGEIQRVDKEYVEEWIRNDPLACLPF